MPQSTPPPIAQELLSFDFILINLGLMSEQGNNYFHAEHLAPCKLKKMP
jgi:hypothetical protein